MGCHTDITALFAADRHREMVERAEVSRMARAARRTRRPWAWLRRGRRLTPQPGLAPALPGPDLAAAPPQRDLAATRPLPAVASAPPPPDPAPTLPLPALSGAAAGRQASPAA
jgi:hypothetical protein